MRRKKDDVEELGERIRQLGSFTEVSKEDLQREYARINRLVKVAGEKIEGEGILVEREVGTANNRHMAMVENETLMPYKKLVGMMVATSKVLDQLKRSPATGDDADEFAEF